MSDFTSMSIRAYQTTNCCHKTILGKVSPLPLMTGVKTTPLNDIRMSVSSSSRNMQSQTEKVSQPAHEKGTVLVDSSSRASSQYSSLLPASSRANPISARLISADAMSAQAHRRKKSSISPFVAVTRYGDLVV